MSAPTGTGRDPNAQDLLARFLTEAEHIAVLRYSQERHLESDSEVFFLVAMLKTFALLYDRMLHTVAVAEDGRKGIEAAAILAEQNICDTLEKELATLRKVIANTTKMMSFHVNQFSSVTGEMKMLRDELRVATRDATSAYQAYEAIKDDGTGSTLSRMFYNQAKAALDKRVPLFDNTIRALILSTIARETRKTTYIIVGSFVLQVTLAILLRH